MLRHCIPAPPLSSFIRCFWYAEGAPQPHARERLLPNGEASIVFNLRDEEMRLYDAYDSSRFSSCGLAAVTGPRTHCFAIDTASQDRVVGIQFQPGGTFPFFREPASEVANQSSPLDCLWGAAAGEVREQLLTAAFPEAMFAVLRAQIAGAAGPPTGTASGDSVCPCTYLSRAPPRHCFRSDGPHRSEPAAIHRTVSGPDRPDPESLLPGAAFSTRAGDGPSQERGGLGAGRRRWRLLRPAPFHS